MPAPTNGRVAHSPSGPSLSPNAPTTNNLFAKTQDATESVWIAIGTSFPHIHPASQWLRPLIAHLVLHSGRAAEAMGDLDRALGAYERALIINSQSWAALTMAAHVCRCKEDYGRVSPVTNLLSLSLRFPASFSLFHYSGSCVCAYHTLAFCTRAPPALTAGFSAPWSQAASETTTTTTTKDCRCLSMCIRVCVCVCVIVCVCICLPQISLHF